MTDEVRLLVGETASYNGVLINDDTYRYFLTQEKINKELEKQLSVVAQQRDSQVTESSPIDMFFNNALWFMIGGAVGVLTMEIAR